MGLSSSKTRTTTNQSTAGSEQTSGTQLPLAPPWLTEAAQDYVGRIAAFGDMDPNAFVAPASPLQQMAWQNAGALSGWQGQALGAAQLARSAGEGGPQVAQAPDPAPAFTWDAPQLGGSPLVAGTGYRAPGIAPSQGYAAARVGRPIGVAAGTNAEGIGRYRNPFTDQVVDATLAGLDRAGAEQQARLAASQARTGAFGGSRAGIASGRLAADLVLGRAQAEAGLRARGFDTAAALAGQDADRGLEADTFNAGLASRHALAQAGLDSEASRFRADAENRRVASEAGLRADALRFNADQEQQVQLANQRARQAYDLARFGAQADAARANAAAQQQAGQFDADLAARLAMFNAGQGDNAAARALQAAQLLQNGASAYAGDTRADLAALAALGDQQRQVEQAYALAPLAQLQALGQLSGMTPYDILVGRKVDGTSNTTGTQQGTSVTRSSPSLFDQLMNGLQLGQTLAKMIP